MLLQGNQKLQLPPYSPGKSCFPGFRYQLLLICCVVLSVYYPSISAEISLLDDRDMIKYLAAVTHFDVMGTFFPHSHDGLYYRPMIGISFLTDRFVWNLDPAIMHFENILLHLASAVLVFLIARLIISNTSRIPFYAALIFAVHPIATESVNWISGRTDLLAVLFVLSSLYSIFRFRTSRRFWWLAASAVTLLIGMLAKETAVGLIPALVFILTADRTADAGVARKLHIQHADIISFCVANVLSLASAVFLSNYYLSIGIAFFYYFFMRWCVGNNVKELLLKNFLLFLGSLTFIWALLWGTRKLAFSSQSPHFQRTFSLLFTDFNYSLSLFFKGAGFYAKKFIYPFPLNFVIREVSPFYTLFGIVLLCLVVVLISRRRLSDSLFVAGFCMIAPALPLTFESIAWTSYAERYVYPAAPFWILSLAGYAASADFDRISLRMQRLAFAGVSLLIMAMAALTFQRNIVWQSNLALFKDSVEKTPAYKPVRGLYMTALVEKGMYSEALQQYQIARSLQAIQLKYNPNYDLFYVHMLIAQKQYLKAEQELDSIKMKTAGRESEVYGYFVEIAPGLISATENANEKTRLINKASVSYDNWYDLTEDPMVLYRKGRFLLSQRKYSEAGKVFSKAAAVFPDTHIYRSYSEKLARKLADSL